MNLHRRENARVFDLHKVDRFYHSRAVYVAGRRFCLCPFQEHAILLVALPLYSEALPLRKQLSHKKVNQCSALDSRSSGPGLLLAARDMCSWKRHLILTALSTQVNK